MNLGTEFSSFKKPEARDESITLRNRDTLHAPLRFRISTVVPKMERRLKLSGGNNDLVHHLLVNGQGNCY